MKIHELKCWSEYFYPVDDGVKTLELRKDDRGYAVGDILRLREYSPELGEYLGPECWRRVTHIIRGGPWLAAGYAAMSIAPMEHPSIGTCDDCGAENELIWRTEYNWQCAECLE